VAPYLGIRVLKLGETQKGDPWKRSDPLTIYAHKMLFSQRLKKTTTKNKKNFIQSRKRATGLLILFFFAVQWRLLENALQTLFLEIYIFL